MTLAVDLKVQGVAFVLCHKPSVGCMWMESGRLLEVAIVAEDHDGMALGGSVASSSRLIDWMDWMEDCCSEVVVRF